MNAKDQCWRAARFRALLAAAHILVFSAAALAQADRRPGDYLMKSGSAFTTFSSGNADVAWLAGNVDQRINCPDGVRWIPPSGQVCFTVYHHLQLRYWFPMPDSEQAKLSARTLKVLLEGKGKWPDGAEVYPICIGQGQGVDCDVLIKDGFAYVQELKEELQGGDPAMDELVEEFGKQVGYLDGMGDPTGNGSIVGTTAHIGEMDKLNQQFKKGWDELMGKQGMAATIQTLRNRHLPESMKPSDGKPDGQPGGSVESKANAQARESGVDQSPQQGDPSNDGAASNGTSSKDNPGPFHIKRPFSRWFKTVWDILCRYIDPEKKTCAEIERALAIAYMIMPEVFDHVASFLGRLQDTMTPKSMDDLLNNMSDLYQEAIKFLECIQSIVDLMNDPQFAEALKNFNWKDINIEQVLGAANKAGLISDSKLEWLRANFPLEGLTPGGVLDPKAFGQRLLDHAADKAAEFAEEIPFFGPRLDWQMAKQCAKDPSKDCMMRLARKAAKDGAHELLEREGLREMQGAAGLLIDGKIKEAGVEALIVNMPVTCKNDARNALLSGDSDAWDKVADCVARSPGYGDLMPLVDARKAATQAATNLQDRMSALLKANGVPEGAAGSLLQGKVEGSLAWMARRLHLFSPGGKEQFIHADLTQAMQAELSAPRTNSAMRERQGIERLQHMGNRFESAWELAKAIRKTDARLLRGSITDAQRLQNAVR